jgi:hypothetical protein
VLQYHYSYILRNISGTKQGLNLSLDSLTSSTYEQLVIYGAPHRHEVPFQYNVSEMLGKDHTGRGGRVSLTEHVRGATGGSPLPTAAAVCAGDVFR